MHDIHKFNKMIFVVDILNSVLIIICDLCQSQSRLQIEIALRNVEKHSTEYSNPWPQRNIVQQCARHTHWYLKYIINRLTRLLVQIIKRQTRQAAGANKQSHRRSANVFHWEVIVLNDSQTMDISHFILHASCQLDAFSARFHNALENNDHTREGSREHSSVSRQIS